MNSMLKKALLNFKTRSNLKKRPQMTMMDFQSCQKIAIVYSDLFENESNIQKIVTQLKADQKEVSLLVFCHHPKKKRTSLPSFHNDDVSFFGEIKSDELAYFLKQEYDFALCFDQSRHFVIDYVFSLLKAKCRVGILAPTRDHLFDMMVQSTDDQTPVSGEVLKYLKMIQPYEY